ncbi:MAG: hypothetical protein ACXVGB_00195 [Mycobacteriaceae bacterium]
MRHILTYTIGRKYGRTRVTVRGVLYVLAALWLLNGIFLLLWGAYTLAT